jgi:hypothetical protein
MYFSIVWSKNYIYWLTVLALSNPISTAPAEKDIAVLWQLIYHFKAICHGELELEKLLRWEFIL